MTLSSLKVSLVPRLSKGGGGKESLVHTVCACVKLCTRFARAMTMYAVATLPLIRSLPQDVDQVWYADDASASGSNHCLRAWWDEILNNGPAYGYLANSLKTWLITKPKHLASVEAAFLGTNVNITTEGRPHLGAPLGSMLSLSDKRCLTGALS